MIIMNFAGKLNNKIVICSIAFETNLYIRWWISGGFIAVIYFYL